MNMLPFIVGMVGHRHLPDGEMDVARQVREYLTSLQRLAPETPFVALSSLADGADQLCADVALELGMVLSVVLPKPLAAYRQEINNVERFDRLVKAATDVTVMLGREGTTYAGAADEITRRCHLLVAVWDGGTRHPPKPGGTSYCVARRRGQLDYGSLAGCLDRCGPYHIIPIATAEVTVPVVGKKKDASTVEAHSTLSNLHLLNSDLTKHVGSGVHDNTVPALQTVAGTAARGLHNWSRGLKVGISLATLLVFALQQVGSHYQNFWISVVALAILMFMMLVLWRMKHKSWHDRHLRLRALAEMMRILAAVPDVASSSGQVTTVLQFQSMRWMSRAAFEWSAQASPAPSSLETWIKGQQEYFARARHRARSLHCKLEFGSWSAYVISLVVGTVSLIPWAAGIAISSAFAFFILLATLMEQHAQLGAYVEDSARYSELGILFQTAQNTLSTSPTQREATARELARESLAELGFWYATHVTRAPQVIKT